MIKMQGVHKSFGDLEVLKGIDLDVQKGEVISVIGGKLAIVHEHNPEVSSTKIIGGGVESKD